jgi:hypothetical protein
MPAGGPRRDVSQPETSRLGLPASARRAAKLCHMGHMLMENRNGLVADATTTTATGTAE